MFFSFTISLGKNFLFTLSKTYFLLHLCHPPLNSLNKPIVRRDSKQNFLPQECFYEVLDIFYHSFQKYEQNNKEKESLLLLLFSGTAYYLHSSVLIEDRLPHLS